METNLSSEWSNFMEKQDAFFKSALTYRNTVDLEQQKSDICTSLDDDYGSTVTIRLIKEGYIDISQQPTVWYKMIESIFKVDFSVGRWIVDSLSDLSPDNKALLRFDCLRLIEFYATDCDNDITLYIALSLLEEVGYSSEILSFIEKHNHILMLSQDEIEYYTT
jgi:hypothetical protein